MSILSKLYNKLYPKSYYSIECEYSIFNACYKYYIYYNYPYFVSYTKKVINVLDDEDAANKFLDNHLIKTKTQRREYV